MVLGYYHCPKCKTDTNHKLIESGLTCLKCEKKLKDKQLKAKK